jgi:hypothetical protein
VASGLKYRSLLGQIANGYRYDWRLLLGAGLLVFVPIGAVTAIDPLDGATIDDWSGGWSIVLLLIFAIKFTVPLIGAVFYSGVVAAGEEERRSGVGASLAYVARNLPYRNLIIADIALVAVTIFGFLFLIIPGYIFLTWFALIAPIIEIEGTGVRVAFRRSRELVRPHAWKVAGVVVPLSFLQTALDGGGNQIGHELFGDGFLGNWVGSIAANLLGSPLYALVVLALYFEITRREDV